MSPATKVRSSVLGLGWGVLAALLGAQGVGPDIWGGVLASPVIGLVVSRATFDRFQAGSGRRQAAISLGGLLLGAILFGLALGVIDLIRHPGQRIVDSLGAGIVAVLWGVFVTGFFLFLWPLAYATYWLLAWFDRS